MIQAPPARALERRLHRRRPADRINQGHELTAATRPCAATCTRSGATLAAPPAKPVRPTARKATGWLTRRPADLTTDQTPPGQGRPRRVEPARRVWVADRGFGSAANRAYLTRGAAHYIHAELRSTNTEAAAALAWPGRDRTVAGTFGSRRSTSHPAGTATATTGPDATVRGLPQLRTGRPRRLPRQDRDAPGRVDRRLGYVDRPHT
jgi:hypothetical protein